MLIGLTIVASVIFLWLILLPGLRAFHVQFTIKKYFMRWKTLSPKHKRLVLARCYKSASQQWAIEDMDEVFWDFLQLRWHEMQKTKHYNRRALRDYLEPLFTVTPTSPTNRSES